MPSALDSTMVSLPRLTGYMSGDKTTRGQLDWEMGQGGGQGSKLREVHL